MIYHYSSWTFGHFASESFLGRVGVYGVSIFYILSGLTLYYVYRSKMEQFAQGAIDFVVKRCFRIFPLLWLVILATIAIRMKVPGITSLFLNVTGLFGFVDWSHYIATGSWSIGNELVFYALFLPYIFLFNKNRAVFIAASVLALLLYLYFPFFVLDSSQTLSAQWAVYVRPLNQFFLFLGGMIICHILRDVPMRNVTAILLLAAGLLMFTILPAYGDTIHIVSGVNRVLFTLACFMICAGFYKITIGLPGWMSRPFTLLGEASYSVYLIHPLVFTVSNGAVKFIFKRLSLGPVPTICSLTVAIGATLVVSYFVYEYYEKYFMRIGRQIRSKEKAA